VNIMSENEITIKEAVAIIQENGTYDATIANLKDAGYPGVAKTFADVGKSVTMSDHEEDEDPEVALLGQLLVMDPAKISAALQAAPGFLLHDAVRIAYGMQPEIRAVLLGDVTVPPLYSHAASGGPRLTPSKPFEKSGGQSATQTTGAQTVSFPSDVPLADVIALLQQVARESPSLSVSDVLAEVGRRLVARRNGPVEEGG
jgi:hypothetical protein